MRTWINELWDWFWYYRRGKIRFRVYDFGDTYIASASSGKLAVWNCYGSTPQSAKEMALFKFKQALNKEAKYKEIVYKGNGFTLYREK